MSTLQFSLFFAGLLIGYLLIHSRLVRFEGYLKEISGLKPLNERLQGVSDSIERVRLDRVEEQLGQLHEDLVGLLQQLSRLERTIHQDLVENFVPAPQSASVGSIELTPGERVAAVVETRLLQLGYGDLRILTDLGHVRLEDRIDVRVEARKGEMPCKGTVTVRNGSVVDVALRSVVQSFT